MSFVQQVYIVIDVLEVGNIEVRQKSLPSCKYKPREIICHISLDPTTTQS